ncbi:3-keto-5-aminohexanoate cleavage protein [Jhaorihella thermophila]
MDWTVCAFGPAEHACLLQALRLGGNVRIGFENNLHAPRRHALSPQRRLGPRLRCHRPRRRLSPPRAHATTQPA